LRTRASRLSRIQSSRRFGGDKVRTLIYFDGRWRVALAGEMPYRCMRLAYLAHMLTAAGLYVLRLGEWLLEATHAKTRITAKWRRGLTSSGRIALPGFNHSRKNFIFDYPFYVVYLQKLTHDERANSLSWSSRSAWEWQGDTCLSSHSGRAV
jgi:hypothetical protein